MIKTFFYLKTDKQNSNGESPIYAKIKLYGKTTTLSTGRYITKERWDFTNKLRNQRLNSEKISRTALDSLENKIESIYFELSKGNTNTSLSDIKNNLSGNAAKNSGVDIITLFKKHNDYFEKKVGTGERTKASFTII